MSIFDIQYCVGWWCKDLRLTTHEVGELCWSWSRGVALLRAHTNSPKTAGILSESFERQDRSILAARVLGVSILEERYLNNLGVIDKSIPSYHQELYMRGPRVSRTIATRDIHGDSFATTEVGILMTKCTNKVPILLA